MPSKKTPQPPVEPLTESAKPTDAFNVGSRLRALRQAKGMLIDEVAQKVGVSKSFISRFERDTVQASVATLLRVCEAIGIKPGELFEPPSTKFVAAGQGAPMSLGGDGMREYLICGAGNEHMMALYSVIEPGGGSGPEPYSIKAAADLVHVQSGCLEMRVADETYLLRAGDTLTFAPTDPHTWVNPSKDEVCISLWVIVPPPA